MSPFTDFRRSNSASDSTLVRRRWRLLVLLALFNLMSCQLWPIISENNRLIELPTGTETNVAQTPQVQQTTPTATETSTIPPGQTIMATIGATVAAPTSLVLSATTATPIISSTSASISPAPVESAATVVGQIAFYSNRDGNNEIYLMDEGGHQQVRLTSDPADDLFPHLSPDGRHITFNSYRDGNWEIYLMEIDGGQQTRLTNHPAEDRLPAWSPDGHWIAFSSDRDSTVNIYIMNVDSRDLIQLTYGSDRKSHPTWSPDGRWLAFNAGPTETEWEIYTVPIEGGPTHRLTNNSVIDWGPSWSPTGDSILLLSKRPDNADIYLMGIEPDTEYKIFEGSSYEWGVVWSPDGKFIAFTSNQTGQDEIYTMRLDGSELRPLTDGGGAYPTWSIKPLPNELAAPPVVTPVLSPLDTPLPIIEPTSLPLGACQKPVEDYSRVTINGETINRRTELMLEAAITLYGGPADLKRIAQGSYTGDVAESFGTHTGGGVVDISIRNPVNPEERLFGEAEAMIRALRLAGFAAWYREADLLYSGMAPHIHAVAIGDQELSLAAKEQLIGSSGYFRGYDGLPTDTPNPDPHGGPVICDWMLEMGYADLR